MCDLTFKQPVTNCNGLNAAKVCEVMAKWRGHLEFKFTNGFGIDSAADIGRDMLACLDEIKQSISAPLNTNPAENVNSEKVIYNNAKMYKALITLRKKITDWYMNGWIPHDQYDECKDISETALAEPPRNCDRFKTFAKAARAFVTEMADVYVDVGDVEKDIVGMWLFAEAKGETK